VGLNQRLYVQQDANYNVTSVSNSSGAIVERFRYTPYGQRTVLNDDFTVNTNPTTSDYSFDTGHQGLKHDAETGLIYNRARMLHPTLGRFTSRDPLVYVDGMSVYQLVVSNPVNHVDALGLLTVTIGITAQFVPAMGTHQSIGIVIDDNLNVGIYWTPQVAIGVNAAIGGEVGIASGGVVTGVVGTSTVSANAPGKPIGVSGSVNHPPNALPPPVTGQAASVSAGGGPGGLSAGNGVTLTQGIGNARGAAVGVAGGLVSSPIQIIRRLVVLAPTIFEQATQTQGPIQGQIHLP